MRIAKALLFVSLVSLGCLSALHAQEEYTEGSKLNTNLGITLGVPLNPTAKFVSWGWGFVGGAGYNFNRRNSLIGEFMWNKFYTTNGGLTPLRTIAQAAGLDGSADLFALTGNYRFELRGDTGGVYFIGGGGAYFRHTSLSKQVTSTTGIVCDPAWLWWGFTCTAGTVTSNETITSKTITAMGANGGIGLTHRVGEPPYRVYVESRYHYVPHKGINSQFVTVTFGVRF